MQRDESFTFPRMFVLTSLLNAFFWGGGGRKGVLFHRIYDKYDQARLELSSQVVLNLTLQFAPAT